MPGQGLAELCIIGLDRSTARHHHQIDTLQTRLTLTKCLAHQAFESITIDRTPHLFACYRESQPCLARSDSYRENREVGISRAFRMREHPLKIGGRQQACRSGETAIAYQRGSDNRPA